MRFQFLNGSIKAMVNPNVLGAGMPFQFLNGSIKAIVHMSFILTAVKFQFLNGSIKANRTGIRASLCSCVSIPQWFD